MKKIVVVGGGTMGLDIAHTFARSGHAVVVREISDELAEKSHSRLVAALDKLVARGKMDEAKRAEILGNITFTTDLAAAADADLVLEAILRQAHSVTLALTWGEGELFSPAQKTIASVKRLAAKTGQPVAETPFGGGGPGADGPPLPTWRPTLFCPGAGPL